MKVKHFFILFSVFCFLSSVLLCGCDSFRKKFVRKPKRRKEITVVVSTQEYELTYTLAELYNRYFSLWHGSHEELMNLMVVPEQSQKRKIFMAEKIVDSLKQMRRFLLPEKQTELDPYILGQQDLLEQLEQGNMSRAQKISVNRMLEKNRKEILEKFSYQQVKEYIGDADISE